MKIEILVNIEILTLSETNSGGFNMISVFLDGH